MQLCLQQERRRRRRQQQQQQRQTNKRSTQTFTFGIDNNTPYEFIIHTRNKVNVQPLTHFIESGKNRRATSSCLPKETRKKANQQLSDNVNISKQSSEQLYLYFILSAYGESPVIRRVMLYHF